jgi:hypothetical protein
MLSPDALMHDKTEICSRSFGVMICTLRAPVFARTRPPPLLPAWAPLSSAFQMWEGSY